MNAEVQQFTRDLRRQEAAARNGKYAGWLFVVGKWQYGEDDSRIMRIKVKK